MLTTLLPGIRQLRAPLASGFLWLLGLWLSIRPQLPATGQASGPYKDLLDLADYVGKPAVLAASAFVAYLVGSLSLVAGRGLNRVLYQLADVLRIYEFKWTSRLSPGRWQESETHDALTTTVVSALAKRFLDDESFRTRVITHVTAAQERATAEQRSLAEPLLRLPGPELERMAIQHYYLRRALLIQVVATTAYVDSTEDDLEYVAQRLLGRDDTMHAEYDRERAESTFFAGVALPIGFLVAVLAFRSSLWWAVGTLVSFAFVWLSAEASAKSTKTLASALAAERVEAPVLQRLHNIDIELTPYEGLVSPATLSVE